MLYMSGCLERDCLLLLHTLPDNNSGNVKYKSVMFTPQYDPGQELWDGPRTHHVGAQEVWGVDEGLPISEINHYLNSLEIELSNPNIWYNYKVPNNPEIHRLLHNWLVGERKGKVESPKSHIHTLRLTKSAAEIKLMKETCKISSNSILSVMKKCRSPISEHELFAMVDYQSRMQGAEHLAYPPVIAGGSRANIIHYINNNQNINDGDLVLMDAG